MEHSNKKLLNTQYKVPQLEPDFAELQRKYRILESQEWQKRSLGFNKYVIKRLNPLPDENDIESIVEEL